MTLTKSELIEKLTLLLNEFISDWGLDEEITSTTTFNDDLCFSSVDMLHYLATIDMTLKKKFPYEKLIMQDGVYRNELTLLELAEFIYDNRNIEDQAPKAL